MENYIKNGTANIWTEISGKIHDKYVILCNGGPGCCDYLLPVSKMIDDNFNVIRFEQRGCGRSDKDGNYELETIISDLEAIRKYYGINKWIIGGHSWGANLSLIYAIMYPEFVESILYIAGNGFQNDREWSLEYHNNRDKHGEIMPEMAFPGNEEVNKVGNKTFRRYIQNVNLYKDISMLKITTLFMCAENDIRPNWPVLQIQKLIEKSNQITISGVAHYIWLTHYDEMKDELRKYLKLN